MNRYNHLQTGCTFSSGEATTTKDLKFRLINPQPAGIYGPLITFSPGANKSVREDIAAWIEAAVIVGDRSINISSTTNAKHVEPNHKMGLGVDVNFVGSPGYKPENGKWSEQFHIKNGLNSADVSALVEQLAFGASPARVRDLYSPNFFSDNKHGHRFPDQIQPSAYGWKVHQTHIHIGVQSPSQLGDD